MDTTKRMQELGEQIRYHSHRYHVLDDPIISDDAYDALYRELQELEAAYPELAAPDSPTRRVGGDVREEFAAVEHPRPMLSLQNAFSPSELRAWRDRALRLLPDGYPEPVYIAEPKVDGLTVVLHYEDGLFVLGATRGDGLRGEDITPNLRAVKATPLRIPVGGAEQDRPVAPGRLIVRGEAFMSIEDFEAFNHEQEAAGKRTYANPRNTAAGSLRVLDSAVTAARPLRLLCYQVVEMEGGPPLHGQWDALDYLQRLGFPVSNLNRRFGDFEQLVDHVFGWEKVRETLDFQADGLVIKIDDFGTQARLGAVGNAPRWAVAYKYPAPESVTRLNRIVVNVGRTGSLTPTAELEPVRIGGVTVRNATLHNAELVAERDIREGDMVVVKRAGEVIPQVLRPVLELRPPDTKPWQMPDHCPVCGEPVEHPAGEVATYCVNSACPAQLVRGVEHFVSRGAMDIEGFGIRQAELFVELGLIRNLADIYTLTADQLLPLNSFAEKKVDNLLAAIAASKEQPPDRLLTALGIQGVGAKAAQVLIDHFHSLDSLAAATVEQLQQVSGIGPKLADSIVQWFGHEPNRQVLARLKAAGVRTEVQGVATAGPQPLAGLTFVITGTLPTMSREQAQAFIEARGGKVSSSVSAKTDYLLAGEKPGGKLAKAQALRIPVLDEPALYRLAASG